MRHKRFSGSTVRRFLLLVVVTLFSLSTFGQEAMAFDKNFFAGNNIFFYAPCGDSSATPEGDAATPTEYIKLGNIPPDAEGLEVGASVFGGKKSGDKWVEDLADNGGTDLGNTGNHLTGTTSFAELGINSKGTIGDALGSIPNGSKLEIQYNGKKIIAVKGDVGSGGPDVKNKPRVVDLWWETANLLGFKDGTDTIKIHAVSANTPVTPVTGKASAATDSQSTTSDTCCGASATGAGGSLMGSTREEQIWNFLTGKDGNIPSGDGLSPEQAAGVMGNLKAESGYNPGAVEGGNGIGFGIAQWSFGRRTALEKAAAKKGVKANDLLFQLNYLYKESKGRPVTARGYGKAANEWATQKLQKTVLDATVFWHNNFEVSADSAARVKATRGGFAQDAYNNGMKKYGGGGGANTGAGGGGSTASADTDKPVIFLDPQGGGKVPQSIDSKSGLKTDFIGGPSYAQQSLDTFNIAGQVKTALEAANYKVVLSHNAVGDSVSDRARVDAAAKAKADLAVTLDSLSGDINQVWPQRPGTYRKYGDKTVTFTNGGTSDKSESYATAIAGARTKGEKQTVTTDPGNVTEAKTFSTTSSKGNTPLVNLWSSDVPWVTSEMTQDKGQSISKERQAIYAKSLVDGIEKAIPPKGGMCTSTFTGGDFAKTILAYAWPRYYSPPHIDAQPAYKTAVKKAQSQGRYVGGGANPGIDCGGFVTTLMVDSGFEPKYNSSGKGGYVPIQQSWAAAHWTKIPGTNAADMKPGDVAYTSGHTFTWAGTIPGFGSKIASASYSDTGRAWRAPMAGHETVGYPGAVWYRKK